MKRVKFLKVCCVAAALLLSSCHNMKAAAVEGASLTPCSRVVQEDGAPIPISEHSIAHYVDSPQDLKAFMEELKSAVNTFLEGTWRLKPDDFRALEGLFELFLKSMEGLGEAGLSPEEKEALYVSNLENFCTLHGKENKFASKEWLERYASISHKCIQKPQDGMHPRDNDALNAQLAIRFHFVIPDSWVEVLVDTSLRTDPLQMRRYFYEEATVAENPHFFLKYELSGTERRHPIGTDTINALLSSNHKPDLVEQVWRYLRNLTHGVYRDLRLNALFPGPESLLIEAQLKVLLENNDFPSYPKTEEQAKEVFDILHLTEYSEAQIDRLKKYDMTNTAQHCIAAAEAVSMHFENVRLAVERQSKTNQIA